MEKKMETTVLICIMLGLYRYNGKANGNYYIMLSRGIRF